MIFINNKCPWDLNFEVVMITESRLGIRAKKNSDKAKKINH